MHEAEQSARDARQPPPSESPAGKGEIIAWASYDVANSTYATVVATAVYNAYFVKEIAGGAGLSAGAGTLMLTMVIAVSALMVVFTAPILGTIADATAGKKYWLLASTVCCIIATFMLSWVTPGQYVAGMILLIIANFAFGTGENFIASFLPELTTKDKMGRISAIGWGAGYIGGLFSLSAALAYVSWAQKQRIANTEYVPQILDAVALLFGLLALPTFIWLKERATPDKSIRARDYLNVAFSRLKVTFTHSLYYRDLFNILLAICIYSCGTATVIHLASVYASAVLHFSEKELLGMILVVDITAAIGAFAFGYIQDRIGSVRTLTISLSIWTVAVLLAAVAQQKWHLFLAGNFIGIAMGSAGSAGRALVGRFSPHGRSGEFLGLWGLSMKAAAAIGVLAFGAITYITNDPRLALLCMLVFFVVGLLLVLRVDEARGIAAAEHELPT